MMLAGYQNWRMCCTNLHRQLSQSINQFEFPLKIKWNLDMYFHTLSILLPRWSVHKCVLYFSLELTQVPAAMDLMYAVSLGLLLNNGTHMSRSVLLVVYERPRQSIEWKWPMQ